MDNLNHIAAILCLVTACHAAAPRYVMTTQPSGEIVLKPVNPADVDGDGDVDQDDFAAMQLARTGPGVPTVPATKPGDPPYIPPVTPTNCTVTVGPDDLWQKAVIEAKPGDTICFKGGTYTADGQGWNYTACLAINSSGEPGKTITFRNVPGERPVFSGDKNTWAIRVGYCDYRGPYDPSAKGVHDVTIDGLVATQSAWDGFEVLQSNSITLRNCSAYANNYGSTTGYKAGFNVEASHHITIERCRAYDNGIGIDIGVEQAGNPTPHGVAGIVVKDCFIYGNSRSANLGNSSGLEIWFGDGAVVEGNILWDNPDANFNGEGNLQCRYVGNVCLNSWQTNGNNEGGKLAVRGGGANLIAFNIFAENLNCGFDMTQGVGDVFLNNTCALNGSWGVLLEGSESQMFNTLLCGNSWRAPNGYPEADAPGWSLISDWNVYGRGPIKSTKNDTLYALPPNTIINSVDLRGARLPRTEPRQMNSPEMLWGVSTTEEARAKILSGFKPAEAMAGASLAQVQSLCNQNLSAVRAALDAAIAKAGSSGDHQQKQAKYRYEKLRAELSGYDFSGLPDTKSIGAVK